MAIVLAIVNIHTYRLRGEQIPKYMRHDVSKAKSAEIFITHPGRVTWAWSPALKVTILYGFPTLNVMEPKDWEERKSDGWIE